MVWTPNPNEPSGYFEGPIVNNCKTVLARDFKGALDYYYPSEDLPNFQELVLGPALRNVFPCCGVEPRANSVNESDDRSHQIEVCRVRLYICVTADGPDATTNKLFKYVRVAHLVLQNARSDFFTGMSNPFEVALGFEHAYDVVRGDETIISRAAGIEVTVSLRER
jgi:hypothetical protein